MCCAIPILFAGSSTIVKGTEQQVTVEVEGRRLALTNLDKVLYPGAAFTKAHVIDYYTRIAPLLLPHFAGRPVTMQRFPDGVHGKAFYENPTTQQLAVDGHRHKLNDDVVGKLDCIDELSNGFEPAGVNKLH
jgi:hypothetical protein